MYFKLKQQNKTIEKNKNKKNPVLFYAFLTSDWFHSQANFTVDTNISSSGVPEDKECNDSRVVACYEDTSLCANLCKVTTTFSPECIADAASICVSLIEMLR